MSEFDSSMSRRRLLLNGSALMTLTLLPGCIGLLGIILRGGAVRAFASGARVGGAASMMSVGRGVGIAGRTASARGVSLPQGSNPIRILSRDRVELARSRQDGSSTNLMRGDQQIFRSNANASNPRDIGRLDHVDIHGNNVGNSRYEFDGRVDHYGTRAARGRIGFDVVMRGGRLIKHFDPNENPVGETEVELNDGYSDIIADQATEEYIAELNAQDDRCPELVEARRQYQQTLEACSRRSLAACDRQSDDLARYLREENLCR